MFRSKNKRLSLLEQGVNGIAQLYADLTERFDKVQADLAAATQCIADQRTRLDQAARQWQDCCCGIQRHTEALSTVQSQLDMLARRVNDMDQNKTAHYYTRGVLDEYMYGADKEGKV